MKDIKEISGMMDIELGVDPRGIFTTSALQMLHDEDPIQVPFDNLMFLLLWPYSADDSEEAVPLGRQVASSIRDAIDQFQQ
jgi:hypothetical protein